MKSRGPAVRHACAAVAVVVGGALLWRACAGIDARGTLHVAARAGRLAPLALLPFVLGMALDATGIAILLRTLGRRVSLARLLPIRIATEALHLTAPAGFLVADSATAALLDTRCRVPLAEGGVLAVARKWLVMRAHAAYIALGALCGASLLAGVSTRLLGGAWLPWAVAASGLAPLSLSLALGAGFRGRCAVTRAQDWVASVLARLPGSASAGSAARWRATARKVDGRMALLGASPGATWLAAAAFFAGWLVESVETAVILKLVGGPFEPGFVLATEVGVSLLRSIGNIAPAGLGIQDAGYAVLLRAMGLPAEQAAAFVVLKRGKELTWIVVGYALLAAMRGAKSGVASGPVEAVADAAHAADAASRGAELFA